MAVLHLAAVGFIKPVIDTMKDSGMPVYKLLHRSNLDIYNLTDPYGYIPVRKMYTFLDLVSRELGGDNYPVQFRDKLLVANAGIVGDAMLNCSDLLAAINYAIKYDYLLLSNERVGLEINGAVATARQWYTDKPAPGRSETELLSFCLMVDAIRCFAGSDWSPAAIQIQGTEIPGFDSLVSVSSETKVQFNQPFTSVSFPTSLLNAPLLDDAAKPDKEPDYLPGNKLSAQLQCLLDSSNRQIDLVMASEALGVSSRTLKRYLRDEGTSYSEIVDQWRFNKAVMLLSEPHCTINEISQELHYSNAPNFIRAFTRWTGSSPMSYRERSS